MNQAVTAQRSRKNWLWAVSAAFAGGLAVLPSPGFAQTAPQKPIAPGLEDQADPREKLEILQKKLEEDRARQQALDARRSALAAEAATLQAQLVKAAATARTLESQQAETETRYADLSARESEAARAFEAKRDKLSGLLAVLQRMGREPPPALLVQPQNAADAARSAMILTSVLPGVRTDAQRLSAALSELRALRQEAAKTKVELTRATEALANQRTRVAELLKAKSALVAETSEALSGAQARVLESTRDVRNVEDLIRRVSGDVKTLREAGFSDAHFLAQRGQLPWPANGSIVAHFGEDNELGLKNDGITLQTRPNAQVVSPVDGKIAFAGPFAGYGNMLIISATDDYHIVLTGMADIFGAEGQKLLAGEPVGRMGAEGRDAGVGGRLSIEFRHGRDPVDPKPWFGVQDKQVVDKGHG